MAEVCEGKFVGHSPGVEPLTFSRQVEALEKWKSVCGQAYKLKGIKGIFLFFFLFSFASTLLLLLLWHDGADPAVVGCGDV